MKYLGVIPARAGSKRLPNKNVLPFCGKPLWQWTYLAAFGVLDRIVITTDCQEILDFSQNLQFLGSKSVILHRPRELCGDDVPSWPVVRHAALAAKHHFGDDDPEGVILLQPTSPLRTSADIKEAIEVFEAEAVGYTQSPSLTTLVARDGDFWLASDRTMVPIYRQNGAIYIVTMNRLYQELGQFVDHDTKGYEMPAEHSIDIDTEEDFRRAERLMVERDTSPPKDWFTGG